MSNSILLPADEAGVSGGGWMGPDILRYSDGIAPKVHIVENMEGVDFYLGNDRDWTLRFNEWLRSGFETRDGQIVGWRDPGPRCGNGK